MFTHLRVHIPLDRAASRITRAGLIAAAGSLFAASLAACGSSTHADVVATVGLDPITRATVDHWAKVDLGARGAGDSQPGTRARDALDLLISAGRLTNAGAAAHLAVPETEVDSRLSLYEWNQAHNLKFTPASRSTDFTTLLGRPGTTHSDRRMLIRLDALAGRIELKLLAQLERNLSHAEIAKYYATHHRSYVQPERRDLEVLGNYDKSVVMRAKREIEAGADFLTLARRISIDQEAPNGLELNLAPGIEEPEYDKIVFPAKPGVLYGPYHQIFYFIFKVIKVKPAVQASLADSEADVRRHLVEGRRQEVFNAFLRTLSEQPAGRASCSKAYATAQCGVSSELGFRTGS